VLRALRRESGLTQQAWATVLGYSVATVRRWERDTACPAADGEAALVAECRRLALLRTYQHGPLRGLTLTPELLHEYLADARVHAQANDTGRHGTTRPHSAREWRVHSNVGTVTFLFTDIGDSTRLWLSNRAAMSEALARHDALIERVVAEHAGHLVRPRGEGDSRFVVFPRPSDAAAAACAMQMQFAAEPWLLSEPLRVRMAVHTGEADLRNGDYYGPAVNHCARLRQLAHPGQILVSALAADLIRESLSSSLTLCDLGPHQLRDLAQPEHIWQLLHPGLQTDFPALRHPSPHPHNLPNQPGAFVGRDQAIEELRAGIRTAGLLTLVGPGGIGKTRLAIRVASESVDEYPDGIWLVRLESVADPRMVIPALASALNVRERPGSPLQESVTDWIASHRILLLLDNCEHQVEPCAEIAAALLEACPHLHILATSRERLGIPGERAWPIRPLVAPLPVDDAVLERVARFEAVQLFVDRAASVYPGFTLTRENAPAVAELCRRLDGIPLALELAAARVTLLSPEQMSERLDHALQLLTTGHRTAPPRHRTLEATIAWSYRLLTGAEQHVLESLAVFAGGWTLEAAEAICADARVRVSEVLDLLGQLVDKSLVVAEPRLAGVARYRFLDTVRQFARDRLHHRDDLDEVHRRHAMYYVNVARVADPERLHTYTGASLELLEQEHDNLRAALRWSLTVYEHDIALELGRAMAQFWYIRHPHEGSAWLAELRTATSSSVPSSVRVDLLIRGGELYRAQAAYELAAVYYDEALETARKVMYTRGVAAALDGLGSLAAQTGQPDEARAYYAAALAEAKDLPYETAATAIDLGDLAIAAGDLAAAEDYYRRSGCIQRDMHNEHGLAICLARLGAVALERDDIEAANEYFEQSVAIRVELGGRQFASIALLGLSQVALAWGDLARAAELARECTLAFRDLGRDRDLTRALDQRAAVAAASGDAALAVRLFAAAHAFRARIGFLWPAHEARRFTAYLVDSRRALDEAAAANAWSEGIDMSVDSAVAEATREDRHRLISGSNRGTFTSYGERMVAGRLDC
jgi:predicted ATPase/class 3 adenylate cyclase